MLWCDARVNLIFMKIIEYLISIGYKPFRYTKCGLVPCNNPYDYSTMREGGIDVRLIKDNSTFVFGLHEHKKPPTLISPRTNELQKDDEMNKFLADHSAKEVFESLLKYSIKK
jgi:hypothetical protein